MKRKKNHWCSVFFFKIGGQHKRTGKQKTEFIGNLSCDESMSEKEIGLPVYGLLV